MKFTIKSVEDSRMAHTSKGDRYVEHLVIEGEDKKDYKISRWEKKSHIGDTITGELGKYDSEYKEYKFKEDAESKENAKPPTQEDMSEMAKAEEVKQRRIVIESLIGSAVQLETNKKEPSQGELWQIVSQGYSLIYEDKFIFYCSKEQRESLVKRYGFDIAHEKAYSQFGVVYLHLLTHEQAKMLINQPDVT
jgi:hypothetical protein